MDKMFGILRLGVLASKAEVARRRRELKKRRGSRKELAATEKGGRELIKSSKKNKWRWEMKRMLSKGKGVYTWSTRKK